LILRNRRNLFYRGLTCLARELCNTIYRQLKKEKFNIFNEEWDNLIILDACKYDYFEKLLKKRMKEKLEYRISQGSNTPHSTNTQAFSTFF
jgi:hypothetical protein